MEKKDTDPQSLRAAREVAQVLGIRVSDVETRLADVFATLDTMSKEIVDMQGCYAGLCTDVTALQVQVAHLAATLSTVQSALNKAASKPEIVAKKSKNWMCLVLLPVLMIALMLYVYLRQ